MDLQYVDETICSLFEKLSLADICVPFLEAAKGCVKYKINITANLLVFLLKSYNGFTCLLSQVTSYIVEFLLYCTSFSVQLLSTNNSNCAVIAQQCRHLHAHVAADSVQSVKFCLVFGYQSIQLRQELLPELLFFPIFYIERTSLDALHFQKLLDSKIDRT